MESQTPATTSFLALALVNAALELENPAKSASNPHFKSTYAPLDEIVAYVRPLLAKHGLAVVQGAALLGETPVLRTRLLHTSGEELISDYPLNPVKPDPQGFASAVTYARRYSLLAMLNLAGDDDDDANAASSRPGAKPTPPPATAKPGGNGAAKPAAPPPATAKPASNGAPKPAAPPPAATKPGGNGAAKPAAPPAAAQPAGKGATPPAPPAPPSPTTNPALEQAWATVLPFGNRNNPGLKGKTLAEAERVDPGFVGFLAENSTRPDIKAAAAVVVAARA